MTDQRILEIALANGFKRKGQLDGTTDLNSYVYEFARALLKDSQAEIDALKSENFMLANARDNSRNSAQYLINGIKARKATVEILQRSAVESASLFLLSVASSVHVSEPFRRIAAFRHQELEAALKETKS